MIRSKKDVPGLVVRAAQRMAQLAKHQYEYSTARVAGAGDPIESNTVNPYSASRFQSTGWETKQLDDRTTLADWAVKAVQTLPDAAEAQAPPAGVNHTGPALILAVDRLRRYAAGEKVWVVFDDGDTDINAPEFKMACRRAVKLVLDTFWPVPAPESAQTTPTPYEATMASWLTVGSQVVDTFAQSKTGAVPAVTITDKTPLPADSGRFCWQPESMFFLYWPSDSVRTHYAIPDDVYFHLSGGTKDSLSACTFYPTAEEANTSLNKAVVAWARREPERRKRPE